MRIHDWLELKRTKAFCVGLAVLFGAEQMVWGADMNTLTALRLSAQQERQVDAVHSAAVVTIYDDLYGRTPTAAELKESLEFLRRSPQMAHLVERLAESPESRWRLRQLNPQRIAQRKAETARIAEAVSLMVGDFLRHLAQGSGGERSGLSLPAAPPPASLHSAQAGVAQAGAQGSGQLPTAHSQFSLLPAYR